MIKIWRTAVITAGACAVVAAGVGPAVAQPAKAGPAVSMSVKTLLPKEYGYTFVPFKDGKFSKAKFSGQVTGATAGMVAQLYAQPFPFKKAAAPVAGQRVALTGTSPQSYAFTATPGIATRYRVEILPSATASTPVQATSSTATVYVVTNQPFFGLKATCGRPVCHQTIRIYTILPASAYRTEAPKRLYFYFGLKLAPRVEPGPPAWLNLDRSAKISKVKRISATKFEQTVTFSFRINNDGYRYIFNYCSKASEAKDGVNLPGHHHCGDARVRPSWFLG